MPIYGYECKECGVRFERRQSFSDDPITVCPECAGEVHRLLSPVGIIFKGSGFYVTDNRGSKSGLTTSKKDSDSSSSTSASSGESTSSSSESKSDTAAKAKSESKKSD